MAYTKEQIEWLHDNGYMQDWIYYQQNGKSAQENWIQQQKKILDQVRQREQQKKFEADLEKQIEQKLKEALDDLLKDFQ